MNRLLLGLIVVVGVPLATVLYVALIEWVLLRFPVRLRTWLRPWFWLAPALILLAFFLVYPSLQTVYLSFFNNDSTKPVGFQNYIDALGSKAMLTVFRNNLLWVIFFTGGTVLFGLLIALLADRVKGESLVKGVVFLPMAISYVAAAVIWKLMFQYQPPGQPQTGTLNALLTTLVPGAQPQAWLINQPWNNLALIAIGVWMWTGFSMVILSAGLKGIPVDLIEAARVDGANEGQILWNITLPLMQSTIAVVTTTMLINVLKIFDIVYVMTNGNYSTEVIANRMYKEMFNFHNFGRASAIAVILMLAILPLMLYNIRRFQEQEATR